MDKISKKETEIDSNNDLEPAPLSSFDIGAGSTYLWTTRVCKVAQNPITAYARNHSFAISGRAGFREADLNPSSVEYLLAAVGADLIDGFGSAASRRGVTIDALEARVSGRLNNPLVMLGVVGEVGHAGFETIDAILYASADADEAILLELWEETLVRSPMVNTLQRSINLLVEMKSVG